MIDRKKVIKGLEIQLDDLQKYADATELLTLTQEHAKEILALLKEQPEIVRCKNCKKRYTGLCVREEAGNINNQDDWFCADGKRR